ncbi:MAG: hypothetical protein RJQ34_13635, partial [Balneola sp.]
VMIAPSEPSISLRSWLANNSKGRCSWNFFLEIVRIINKTFFVSELSNFYTSCNCILSSFKPSDPSGSPEFQVDYPAYTI